MASQRHSGVELFRLILSAAPVHTAAYGAIAIVEALIPVAIAWLTKVVLDRLGAEQVGQVLAPAVLLGCFGVLAAVVPQPASYLSKQIGRRVGLLSLDRLYRAINKFIGLGPFESPAFRDRLRLAQQGSSTVIHSVAMAFGLGQSLLTLVGFFSALVIVSKAAAAIVIVTVLPALFLEFSLSRKRMQLLWDISPHQRREAFYANLLTDTRAAKETRLFGLGGFLRRRMLRERMTADTAERAMDRREMSTYSFLQALAAVTAGGGLVWAILAASHGELSIGDVSIFAAAVASTQTSMGALVHGIAGVREQLLLFRPFVDIAHGEPDLMLAAKPVPTPPLGQALELRDVWFRYSDSHPWILAGVNLVIPRGTVMGLVGLNGSGKSTLVKLISRLYDPTRGEILWDGVDIRNFDPGDYRERISAVFQDHMSYDFSAADNIAVGDLSAMADRARIRDAAVQAGIHAKLEHLPQGYDTLLTRIFNQEGADGETDDGVVLSGGQWQRLALARAFLRGDRDLMILDEPSSGLDPEAEHDVHDRMRRYRADRTSLLISHRLNAVRDADLIAVLHFGVVSELGNHDQLVASGGVYARLFAMQAAGYQDDRVLSIESSR
ncbi:ABC transporter ATP-binding protein [Micromonospora zhanjiangensis]|uniref:ABC transporter ATP-binding protein n=1 Tax=Micromonospora zhanjiangensis TaxID=1522057 RepID=A0ABV8KPQ6_9ACTN